jgi:ABC-type dipeptide transport system, periplasmic component
MLRNRRRNVAGALLVAASLLAGGCAASESGGVGGDDDGEKIFVLAVDGITNSADANNYTGIGHRIIFDPIKAPLWQYKTFDENGGKVTSPEDMVGFLVESWEFVDGGIDVTLKEGIKSAAGNTLTSEDVKWTLERVFAVEDSVGVGLAQRAGINPEEPVTVIDERNLRINAEVNYLTLGILDGYQFFPLDSKTVQENSGPDDPWGKEYLSTHSATFGPYQITEFVPSESVTYERNPNFTLFETAWDRIVLRHVPDPATRVSLLQTGEAQYIGQVGFESLGELRNDSRATILSTQFGSQDVLELTKTFEPFQDERVRKAISYALDRQALADGPYRGFAAPSTSIVSTAINTHNSTDDAFNFNQDKARELLADAGYEDLSFTIYANETSMSGPADSVLTALAQQLGDVGIKVSVQTVASPQDFRAAYSEGKYEAWIRSEGPLQVDAQYLLNLYHHTNAPSNFQAQSDPIIDAAIDAAGPLRGEERQAAIAPAIEQFNKTMLNVPLVETSRVDVYSSSVCPGARNLSYLIQPQYAKPGPCS